MEKRININTNDGHIIYGTLNQSARKSDTLLIFVHGLTGSQNEHQYFNAAPYFTKTGFDTYRFDFYHYGDKARLLSECTITNHAGDLTKIINNFKNKYKKLILIGHSLGCAVILNTDLKNIFKIILWDPTVGMKTIEEKDCIYDVTADKYILVWGKEIIIGKKMLDEWHAFADLKKQIIKINKPCKFIFAGKNTNIKLWEPLLHFIKTPCESTTVKNATHVFVEEGAEAELFKETLAWIKK